MQQWKRHAAALTAGVLLTGTAGTERIRFSVPDTQGICSVTEFAKQLSACAMPETLIDAVYYSPETQSVRCDGMTAAECRSQFPVVNGKPAVSPKAAGIADETREYLTVEEAAALIGCETEEQNGETVLRFPFQSARLIVKSEGTVDPHGGTELAGGFRGLHVIQYDAQADCYAAYLAYQNDPQIEYAEPDRIYQTAEAAGEIPESAYSWGRKAIGADSYIEWLKSEKEKLPEVVAAVIDTGVNAEHNWLRNRVLADKGMSFDDYSCGSWDDRLGHGTHCAGIIVQSTPENVKILPVRVMNEKGWGTSLGIYCGILYAVEQGADVISLSIGGVGDSPLEKEAVHAAREAGIPCCAAAMNDGGNAYYGTLSGIPECVTVSALDEDKKLASYSNYGSVVDFAAPGSGIQSSIPGAPDAVDVMSGTSMATPFAAAAFADLLSYDDTLSFEKMYAVLKNNAKDLGEPGFDERFGWGMIDLNGISFHVSECTPPHIQIDGNYQSGYAESDMPLDVLLLPESPEDEIYYTLDGSVPSKENGIRYTKRIFVDQSALVQAVSYSGGNASRIVSARICISGQEVRNPYVVQDGVFVRYNGVMQTLDLRNAFAENELKAVGDEAFANSRVQNIQLPDSVAALGSHLFDGTEIRSLEAKGVTSVADAAFDGCCTLNTLKLGTLRKIGKNAFRDTESVFGYVTLDKSLTVIPKGAFQRSSVNVECCWEKLTEIGDYAFEQFGNQEPITLSALKTLGKGAFYDSKVREVTFSDALTELPDYAFKGAELNRLTAPGVTKIGAEALAVFTDDIEAWDGFRLNYDKITSIGTAAFSGIRFDAPVTFSALTALSPYAFAGVSGEKIVLPAVTSFNSAALDGCETLISVPNAERIVFDAGDMGFAMLKDHLPKLSYYALEAGSALKEIADGALSASPEYADVNPEDWKQAPQYLTGPADSVLRDYAEKYGICYLPERGIAPAGGMQTSLTAEPFAAQELRLVQIGEADCTVRWFTVRDERETLLPDAEGLTCLYTADTPGETVVRAVMLCGDERVNQVDFHVTVPDFVLLDDVPVCTDGETRLFDWNAMRETYAANLTDGHILTAVYRFTAEKTGDYYIAQASQNGYTKFLNGKKEIPVSDESTADYSAFALEKGKQYSIRFQHDYEKNLLPYSTVRIRNHFFSALKTVGTHGGLEASDQNGFFLVDENGSVLTDTDKLYIRKTQHSGTDVENEQLMNGTDYISVSYYVSAEDKGKGITAGGKTAAYGIGEYCGFRTDNVDADKVFILKGTLRAGSETQTVQVEHFRTAYRFVPETDGEYVCYAVFSDDAVTEHPEEALRVKAYAADGSALTACRQSGYSLVMTLKGGQTYYFEAGAGCSALGISAEKNVLNGDCTAVCTQTEISAGDALPEVTVQDAQKQLLKAGTDYTVTTVGTAAHSGCVKLIVRGTGAYCGTMVIPVYVYETIGAEQEVQVPVQSGRLNYRFVPEEDGAYTVCLMHAENTAGQTGTVWFDMPDADRKGSLQTASLKAGEQISVFAEGISVPQILVIRKGALQPLGSMEVSEKITVFAGEPVKAGCTVKDAAGKTLAEGTDYTIVYSGNDRLGEMTVTARGIGAYCGTVTASVMLCAALRADNAPQIIAPKTESEFLFTPEQDGLYSIRTALSEKNTDEIYASGVYDADLVQLDTGIRLWEGDNLLKMSPAAGGGGAEIRDYALKAGRQYRITVSNSSENLSAALYLLKEKKHILQLNAEMMPQICLYTGYPQNVTVRVLDGEKVLTENEDYSVRVMNNIEVGKMQVFIRGIGNYCGETIMEREITPVYRFIEPDEPLQFIPDGNHAFRFTLNYDTYLSVEKISGQGITLEAKLSTGWSFSQVDSTPKLIRAGNYLLEVEISGTPYFDHEPVTFCLREKIIPIYAADVRGGSAVYTGREIKPHFDISYEGILLTEGADYEILCDKSICEPGSYAVRLEGKGRCHDNWEVSFTVLPDASEKQPMLTEGENKAVLSAGKAAFFAWTPSRTSYTIAKSDLRNTLIRVYDAEGGIVHEMEGIGAQYSKVQVQPDQTYCVSISYKDITAAGETALTLSAELKLLDSCTVEIPQTVIRNGNGEIPAFTVKNGAQILKKGTDYEVFTCGGLSHLGRCCLTLRGCGAYIGEKRVYFYSVPEKLTDAADPQNRSMNSFTVPEYRILPDRTVNGLHNLPGYACCYAYTAERDGTYYLTLPDSVHDEISAFVYDGEGTLLPEGTTEITLRAGSTCRIFCVSNFYVEQDIADDKPFYLKISQYPQPYEIRTGGACYRIENGKAVLTGLEGNVFGIAVPEEITDSVSEIRYPFGGIDAEAFSDRIDRTTIYGEKDGSVSVFCAENGYCFAVLDAAHATSGDLTGDGVTDYADAMTLQRYVTEGEGILLSDVQLAAADMNGDGSLDSDDVMLLYALASKRQGRK